MPICYFNNDYTKEYQCTYSEFKNSIEVNIESVSYTHLTLPTIA